MKKRYQVFVSSTYNDLIEERAIVKKALLEKGLFPTAMEEFPAVDLNQMDYIKELKAIQDLNTNMQKRKKYQFLL